RQTGVVRDACQLAMQSVARSEQQRHEGRRGWNDRMSETGRDLEADAIAAAFWKRTAARREHDSTGADLAGTRDNAKPRGVLLDRLNARASHDRYTGVACGADERVENVPRTIRIGKQLAVLFFVQPHAEDSKERDCVGDGQAAQHAAHDRPPSSPEVR